MLLRGSSELRFPIGSKNLRPFTLTNWVVTQSSHSMLGEHDSKSLVVVSGLRRAAMTARDNHARKKSFSLTFSFSFAAACRHIQIRSDMVLRLALEDHLF